MLAKPKKAKKPSQISTSPFTEFPTPTKGGVKLKKKVRTALQIQQDIDAVVSKEPKRKVGRPTKRKRGGKRMRKFYKTENFNLEGRNNDPPLALREALPGKKLGTYSDEEDPKKQT